MRASPIEREILVEAPPVVVFTFFTDPSLIARWLGANAIVDARVGGSLRIEFPRPDGTDVMSGTFVALDPPRRVVFTWGFAGRLDLPPGSTMVEVTFTPDGTGTRVRLVHSDLPDAERAKHDGGWDYFLGRLADATR